MINKLAIIIIILLFSCVYSFEILTGVKVGYLGWRPYLEEIGEKLEYTGWQHLETGSGLMYGPNLSLIFGKRFSLSASFLYGQLSSRYDVTYSAVFPGEPGSSEYDLIGMVRIWRGDLDIALSYNIIRYLRVFAGFKYQPTKLEVKYAGIKTSNYNNTAIVLRESDIFELKNFAPAMGIGFLLPLTEKSVYTVNISALYLRGTLKVKSSYQWTKIGDIESGEGNDRMDFNITGCGVSADPAFMFTVKPRVVFVVGFRVQYIYAIGEKTYTSFADNVNLYRKLNGHDAVFGCMVSVNYKL